MRSIHARKPDVRERAKLANAAGALLVFAACRSEVKPPIGSARAIPPQRGGILHTAYYTDVRSLDPALSGDETASTIGGLVFDRLMTYDARGRLVPQLASSVDVLEQGTHYVLSLRRGVLFHDGAELTALDVKRSLERALHVNTPCPVPTFFARIRGYAAYHSGQAPELVGIHASGRYVVSFRLSEPDPVFLHMLALPNAAPVCASAGRIYTRTANNQCGSGPFKVRRFEQGQAVELVRHAGYWDKGKPYLDGIDWQLAVPHTSQRFKFERGDLDYMRDFTEVDSLLFRISPAWRGLGSWQSTLSSTGVFMNTELRPFDNRHLRRAVAFGLNHAQVARLKPGHALPHPRMVPKAILPDWPGMRVQYYDRTRALEEMRLAGYAYDPKSGRGGYPDVIRYLTLIDSYAQVAAEVHQQQLAQIGIRVRVEGMGWPAFLAKSTRRKTAQMGYAAWSADYPDASNFFEPILASSAIQDEESQNAAFFSNRELDDLLLAARATSDAAARERLFRRAEEIVAREAPWALGYSVRKFELWHPYVHGYTPHPLLNQHLRDAWLDRKYARAALDLGPLERALPRFARAGQRPLRALAALAGAAR
jgi:ABC-type transport system substrate-binding protein